MLGAGALALSATGAIAEKTDRKTLDLPENCIVQLNQYIEEIKHEIFICLGTNPPDIIKLPDGKIIDMFDAYIVRSGKNTQLEYSIRYPDLDEDTTLELPEGFLTKRNLIYGLGKYGKFGGRKVGEEGGYECYQNTHHEYCDNDNLPLEYKDKFNIIYEYKGNIHLLSTITDGTMGVIKGEEL